MDARRGYGDWLQPFQHNEDQLRGDTERSLIGTAYFAFTADIASNISKVLGKPDEAAAMASLATEVRTAFAKTFWKPEGCLSSNTQTAYLLALAFDLIPEGTSATIVFPFGEARDILWKGRTIEKVAFKHSDRTALKAPPWLTYVYGQDVSQLVNRPIGRPYP